MSQLGGSAGSFDFWSQWVNFGFIEASGTFSTDFSLTLSVMTTGLDLKVKTWMKLFFGHEHRTKIFYKFFLVWWKTNIRKSK